MQQGKKRPFNIILSAAALLALALGLDWQVRPALIGALTPGLTAWRFALALAIAGALLRRWRGLPARWTEGLGLALLCRGLVPELDSNLPAFLLALWPLAALALHQGLESVESALSRRFRWAPLAGVALLGLVGVGLNGGHWAPLLLTLLAALAAALLQPREGGLPALSLFAAFTLGRVAWHLQMGELRLNAAFGAYTVFGLALAALWQRARALPGLAVAALGAGIAVAVTADGGLATVWGGATAVLALLWLLQPLWRGFVGAEDGPWAAWRPALQAWGLGVLAFWALQQAVAGGLAWSWLSDVVGLDHGGPYSAVLLAWVLRRRLGRPARFWEGLGLAVLAFEVLGISSALGVAVVAYAFLDWESQLARLRRVLPQGLPDWAEGALVLGGLEAYFFSSDPEGHGKALVLCAAALLTGLSRAVLLGKEPRYRRSLLLAAAVLIGAKGRAGVDADLGLSLAAFALWTSVPVRPRLGLAWLVAALTAALVPMVQARHLDWDPIIGLGLLVLLWTLWWILRGRPGTRKDDSGIPAPEASAGAATLPRALAPASAFLEPVVRGVQDLREALKRLAGTQGPQIRALGGRVAALWADRRSRLRLIVGTFLVVLFGAGLRGYQQSLCRVLEMTPSGELNDTRAVVQVRFSEAVRQSGDLSQALTLEPAVSARVYLADPRTLILMPQAPLAPGTRYYARFSPRGLSSGRWRIQSASTRFHTRGLGVETLRLFFKEAGPGQDDRELMGEIDFNQPVAKEDLQAALSLRRAGTSLSYALETGLLPSRYYFHLGGLKPGDETQRFEATVAKGLRCQGCADGMAEAVTKTLDLPARPKMVVEKAELNHLPGETLVALRFSLPLADGARGHLRVQEHQASGRWTDLPFNLETEHVYAVLRAKFQPNRDYRVQVLPGISASNGQAFEAKEPWSYEVKLEDAPPYAHFKEKGHYLPARGGRAVDVATRNLDRVQLSVEKIYRPNLVLYLQSHDGWKYGRQVAPLSLEVKGGRINEEVLTRVPLGSYIDAAHPGLFNLSLRGKSWDERDDNWLLSTDIGLVAKTTGKDLWVQAVSIQGLQPMPGVALELVDRKNVVLARQISDAQGRALFRDWRAELEPFVVVASRGEDLSFLRLDEGSLDSSRFDTGGEAAGGSGLDGFLSSERGLYRPGETVHLTAVLRRADLEPARVAARLDVKGPDGQLLLGADFRPDAEGMAVFAVPLPAGASTGQCQASIRLPNGVQLAAASFKVEEFIPNKIRAEIHGPRKALLAGSRLEYTVQARHLFGAAAVSLTVKTAVELVAKDFAPEGFAGYSFRDPERRLEMDSLRVPAGRTDASGTYKVALDLPASVLPASMMLARIYGEVTDSGGRPVGANAQVEVHRYPYYLGLKLPGTAKRGAQVPVDWACVSPDGKAHAEAGVPLLITRKTWYSLFRQADWGGKGFDAASYDELVESRKLDLRGGRGRFSFKADKAGEYTVRLGGEEGARAAWTLRIGEPGGEAGLAAAGLGDPGRLALSFGKPAYKPGETARLRVRAPFAGRLIVGLEREKLFSSLTREVPAGLSELNLPVGAELQPNAYVTALLVRRPTEALRDLPMVSFGVAPLMLDNSGRRLDLKWPGQPEKLASAKGLAVDLRTGQPGAEVVLAAVDAGILDIINFQSPDPFKYFYRKRGLSTETYSSLGEVLPDLRTRLAAGGDEDEAFYKRHLNPVAAKRSRSFALFSGILRADAGGRVRWKVPTDGFQGELRVMALAVKGKRFGGRGFPVKVSDPVVLSPSFPRFLAPGDSVDLPVELFNQSGKDLNLKLGLSLGGPIRAGSPAPGPLALADGAQERQVLRVQALDDAGAARLVVKADSAAGSFSRSVELPVRPGQPLRSDVRSGRLAPGQSASLDVPGDYIQAGRRVRLHVSGDPLVEYLGALDALLRYPYGCAEQTASAAFPLLYLKDLEAVQGRFGLKGGASSDAVAARYVQAAIRKLEAMQLADGGFVLWPGALRVRGAQFRPGAEPAGRADDGEEASDGADVEAAADKDVDLEAQAESNRWQPEADDYLSDYIAHFLLEADRLGHPVQPLVLERIRKRLGAIQAVKAGRLDRRAQGSGEGPGSPYLLYLRALAGKPDRQRMEAVRLGAFKAKAPGLFDLSLLSLAYSAAGDAAAAAALLPAKPAVGKAYRDRGWRWDSSVRDLAAFLLAKSAAGAPAEDLRPLMEQLGAQMQGGHFGSTQEDAWALLALSRASERLRQNQPVKASVSVAGGPSFSLGEGKRSLSDPALFGRRLSLRNDGPGELRYLLLAEGTPLKGPAGSEEHGLKVGREYRDEQGRTLNLGSVAQGQLVVVTVFVEARQPQDDLVLVDLLPAGFEVDNPRLRSQGRLGFEPETSLDPASLDFRDDRVLIFPGRIEGRRAFSYTVRAVSPGSFAVPALLAEAMYDPAVHARWDPGTRLIVAPGRD